MADKVEQVSESVNVEGDTKTVTRKVNTASEGENVNYAARVIWFLIGLLLALLALRVVLALLGADLNNAFASFIYGVTEIFVWPFRGLFNVGEFNAGSARLEVETLFAMFIYALIGWGLASAVRLASKKEV
jgi:uncharacterized protein YggT (Ycf19 family)